MDNFFYQCYYKFTYSYLINIRAYFIELVFFQTDIFAQTPVTFFFNKWKWHILRKEYINVLRYLLNWLSGLIYNHLINSFHNWLKKYWRICIFPLSVVIFLVKYPEMPE
jgi:hypothetical protein